MSTAENYIAKIPLPKFRVWDKMRCRNSLVSFDLEITGRCNNNCSHCYINLPATDKSAKAKELSFSQIKTIVDQAYSLGALWCLITGGEPLLREDFFEIYIYLKKKGFLISVFTNATLITNEHIELFKRYPPRDIEMTVYGVTQDTYEKVSRVKGSFTKFMRGLGLLLENGVRVRFKAMALRSNLDEFQQISEFCREKTKDYFRFDPFLHLRFDGDKRKNAEIKAQRLSAEEIVKIEQADPERSRALEKNCDKFILPESGHNSCNHLFHCGTGNGSFTVSYDGYFRLCSSLWHPECLYDLKIGSLRQAYEEFVPQVRSMRSSNKEFLDKCRNCPIINLCIWCSAHAHLETGKLDMPVDYFCEVAHARADMLKKK
jgi:radical SAM protein with 4Fe4S-binding SPASM domain